MELANVSRQIAVDALFQYKEVWLAVDALMVKPIVSGEKYIPLKRKLDTGLTSAQEEICLKGRWLQEKVNAVFSVAHSQTLPSRSGAEQIDQDLASAVEVPLVELLPEQPQDSAEQITQHPLQSSLPL